MNTHLVSLSLVVLGVFFMIASMFVNAKTQAVVPPSLKKHFRGMAALMLLFLVGYIAYLRIELYGIPFPMHVLIGPVFLLGSIFVFIVIGLNKRTITAINANTKRLQQSHDELEAKVEERTADLASANAALQDENLRRQEAQKGLARSHAELDQIFNTAADGMRLVDLDLRMIKVNDTFAAMVGEDKASLTNRKCHEVLHGESCGTPDCPLEQIRSGKAERIEVEAKRTAKGNEEISCLITATPFRGADGELLGIIEDFRDVSALKAVEKKLEILSVTDELTGAFNRRGFMQTAQKHFKVVDRLKGYIFLLYADLDGLKAINDTLGHEAGDEAIREAGSLLLATYRESDVVGRMGGDEFAVLLVVYPVTEHDPERRVVERLEENIAAANAKPSRSYTLAMSIGVVRYDPDTHSDVEGLLADADKLMYERKRARKKAQALTARTANPRLMPHVR